jgi:hypothetical protein
MAVIGFRDKSQRWVVAGWAYRQVLEDVVSHCPDDSELIESATVAMEGDGLLTEFLEPRVAARMTNALREVTAHVLSGMIRSGIYDKPYGGAHTVEQYMLGLRELMKIIPPKERHE